MKLIKNNFVNILLALLFLSITSCDNDETPTPDVPKLGYITKDCKYSVSGVNLRCGELTVLEDYNKPQGRRITLPVVIIPSLSQTPKSDPIVYLEGGPGATPIPVIGEFTTFTELREDRDLIFMAPRGTPGTSTDLSCASTDLSALKACYSKFKSEGIDLEQYSNLNTARDFQELRKGLNLDQWNLFGISYGTTLGMYIMRQDPEGTRSVILDSPTAPNTDVAYSDTFSSIKAIDAMFKKCESDFNCKKRFGDLKQTFLNVLKTVSNTPFEINSDELKECLKVTSIDNKIFLQIVIGCLKEIYTMDRAPALIDAINRQDKNALLRICDITPPTFPQTQGFEGSEDSVGLHFSIYCGEVHYSKYEQGAQETLPTWANGLWELLTPEFITACRNKVWPISPIDQNLVQSVISDKPTLILTGALDPLTNIDEANRAAAGLSNAQSYIVPFTGHGVVIRKCSLELMRDFLSDPLQQIDTSCLSAIPPLQFRTDL
ncbi:hypothetical protein ATO12_17040 [Aquimarina atlantica]|uniref:AB hydrolase-1 domain-containing protein n=1 Tax=Aquimarina atlantica TaxID=1317122 RepID=A0A023BUD5_9FLAO|nr:alpha/beta fold hydrolase [Aquimarina atlantica]EZH73642.1 hypothetical protein ATO12_17040 [Aquimarina atlantica]